ncbi:Rrf2 family transcriptional regulator [Streptomyces wuyuanensis]|uniref:Rrf2 family transcriptional regulator n=1 Tax=Streptomyces wuyuanensis TaxID=1196353 RepID=UPI00341ED468
MAANSRLTIATHALAWLALAQRRGQEVLTSEQVAASVNTNPVIIRRSLGDLRRAGLVKVRHGAGAGWSLAREPGEITMLEVYDAVDAHPPFGLHRTEPNQECPVGRGIRPALDGVYGRVEQVMRRELADMSIADVLRDALVDQPTVRLQGDRRAACGNRHCSNS